MHEGRLFKILYYLLDKGQATAPELAREFEVSVRTIYRDIDALSAAGVPVYSETGRGGGVRLLNNSILDKTVLSEKEKQDILSALQSLAAVGTLYEKATLQKLSALFQLPSSDWFEVDFSRWGVQTQDHEKFELFKTAVISHRCVRITYAGSYTAESTRTIQPLKLLYKSRSWYLKAYCTERHDFRLFKLSRILKWQLLDETFIPVPFPDSPSGREHQPEQENVLLRFPGEMAYRVYDEFDTPNVQREPGGDLLVSAPLPADAWLTGFLLSFGTQVEVVAPAYLRDLLAANAKEIYEKNKK